MLIWLSFWTKIVNVYAFFICSKYVKLFEIKIKEKKQNKTNKKQKYKTKQQDKTNNNEFQTLVTIINRHDLWVFKVSRQSGKSVRLLPEDEKRKRIVSCRNPSCWENITTRVKVSTLYHQSETVTHAFRALRAGQKWARMDPNADISEKNRLSKIYWSVYFGSICSSKPDYSKFGISLEVSDTSAQTQYVTLTICPIKS